jgi:hypothetical protein
VRLLKKFWNYTVTTSGRMERRYLMFKSFKSIKGKIITALMSAMLVAGSLPLTMSVQAIAPPPPITTPAFTMARVDRTTVEAGQTVTFMIRTVNATQVSAQVNGAVVQAIAGDPIPATGEQNWSLSFTPNETQIVPVHARAAHTDNAGEVSIPITVTGAGAAAAQPPAAPPAPPAVPGQHVIHEITEIPATARNMVTLRIVTDDGVNYVWVGPLGPDQFARGERQSSADGRTVWHVTYRPPGNQAHTTTVAANAAFVLDYRMASDTVNVRLSAPYVPPVRPADAGINRVSADTETVIDGEQARISVRTGRDVQHVWAMVDGRRVNGRRDGLSNWNINVRPTRTQTIQIFANTENSEEGADTDEIRITVRGALNPRITEIRSSQTSGLTIHQSVTLEVTTNLDAEHVWAVVGGSNQRATRVETRANNIIWEIRNVVPPNAGTNTIWVYANVNQQATGAHRQSITLNVITN